MKKIFVTFCLVGFCLVGFGQFRSETPPAVSDTGRHALLTPPPFTLWFPPGDTIRRIYINMGNKYKYESLITGQRLNTIIDSLLLVTSGIYKRLDDSTARDGFAKREYVQHFFVQKQDSDNLETGYFPNSRADTKTDTSFHDNLRHLAERNYSSLTNVPDLGLKRDTSSHDNLRHLTEKSYNSLTETPNLTLKTDTSFHDNLRHLAERKYESLTDKPDLDIYREKTTPITYAEITSKPNLAIYRERSDTIDHDGTASVGELRKKIPLAEKGVNNGVATLDAGGKVPASQLIATTYPHKGVWNAATNTPTLADGTGTAGWVYLVTTGGTVNLGSGNITFAVNEHAVYSGTIWQKSGSSSAVSSVNSQTGVVVLNTDNIAEGSTNKYSTGNLWKRTGTTLSPNTTNDNIDNGNGKVTTGMVSSDSIMAKNRTSGLVFDTSGSVTIDTSYTTYSTTLDKMEYSTNALAQMAYVTSADSVAEGAQGTIDAETKLLVHFNGANDGTTFSDTATNKQITNPNNGVLTKTGIKKFGTAAGYFNGASYLHLNDNADWDFGTGTFSVDFWVYPTSADFSGYLPMVASGNYNTPENTHGWTIYTRDSGVVKLSTNGSSVNQVTSGDQVLTMNTWNHIAVIKKGTGSTDFNIYVNGVAGNAPETGNVITDAGTYGLTIGRYYNDLNGYYYTGYLDELRISKGVARWTSNFTLPARQYPYVQAGSSGIALQVQSTTIKTEGSNAIKGIAMKDSTGFTLTRSIVEPINLSTADTLKFDIRSTRTGQNLKVTVKDKTSNYAIDVTPTIAVANQYQTVRTNIANIAPTNRDSINKIIITVIDAAAADTFYVDNMFTNEKDTTITETMHGGGIELRLRGYKVFVADSSKNIEVVNKLKGPVINVTDSLTVQAATYTSGGYSILVRNDANGRVEKIPSSSISLTDTKWNGGSETLVAATGRASLGLGTAALSSASTFVPYTGATGNVTLGANTITAGNFILSSDRRLKMKIKPIDFTGVNIKYYQYRAISDTSQIRYGVMADEVQKTNPELVRKDENGMLSVAYIDLLIKEIAALKQRVLELEKTIQP